jgi:hypothetical protein
MTVMDRAMMPKALTLHQVCRPQRPGSRREGQELQAGRSKDDLQPATAIPKLPPDFHLACSRTTHEWVHFVDLALLAELRKHDPHLLA